jgi:hypothetical protein
MNIKTSKHHLGLASTCGISPCLSRIMRLMGLSDPLRLALHLNIKNEFIRSENPIGVIFRKTNARDVTDFEIT